MDERAKVAPADMRRKLARADKHEAFRTRAMHPGRIAATFTTEEKLKGLVIHTLARLKRVLENATPAHPSPARRTRHETAVIAPSSVPAVRDPCRSGNRRLIGGEIQPLV